jgi:hypothetical protein
MRIPDDSSQVYDRRLIGSDRTKLINLTAPVTLSSAANSGGHCQNQGRLCFGNDWDFAEFPVWRRELGKPDIQPLLPGHPYPGRSQQDACPLRRCTASQGLDIALRGSHTARMGGASHLIGQKLVGDRAKEEWNVLEQIKLQSSLTPGQFSVGYRVKSVSGKEGFLKASDIGML